MLSGLSNGEAGWAALARAKGLGAGLGAEPGVTVFEGVLSRVGARQLSAARLRAKELGSDPPGTGSDGKTLSRRVTRWDLYIWKIP